MCVRVFPLRLFVCVCMCVCVCGGGFLYLVQGESVDRSPCQVTVAETGGDRRHTLRILVLYLGKIIRRSQTERPAVRQADKHPDRQEMTSALKDCLMTVRITNTKKREKERGRILRDASVGISRNGQGFKQCFISPRNQTRGCLHIDPSQKSFKSPSCS